MAKARKKTSPVVDPVAGDSVPPPKRSPIPLPKGWQRASEALDRIEAVSTIFPDFNRASRCGGLPVNRMHTIHGPTHGGKSLGPNQRILTPSGWKRFGDVKVGDIVTGRDGRPYPVTGVYPQGLLQTYKITLSDGTVTHSCDDHLWFTTTKQEWLRGSYVRGGRPERTRVPTGKHGEGSVKPLSDIRATLEASHELPLVGPVHYDGVDRTQLPIGPYVLGLLLGDGGFTGSCLMFHKPEEDLRAAVAQGLLGGDTIAVADETSIRVRGTVTLAEIERLGLRGCRSWEKFVPDQYMFAHPEDRLELLRGLFDSDGHVVRDGERVEYTTTSPRLAEQAVELARGLGAYVTCSWRTTSYELRGEKKDGRPSARINVYFENTVPVKSHKNLAKWTRGRDGTQRIRRTIVAVEPAAFEECQCISVDSPDNLFVIDDYVVTHNTAFVLGLMQSFLLGGHVAAYVDAEHSTPQEFVTEIMGDLEQHSGFFGIRPKTYEETIDAVDEFLKAMSERRKTDPSLYSICVIDSINKLQPSRELRNVMKDGGDELAKGHAGRYRAAVNQAWLNHLSPRLKAAGCAMVFIAQERDPGDGELWEADGGVEIKGGQALSFDASMLIRVSKAFPMRDTSTATEKSKGETVGFAHRVRIYKSKVSHMDGAYSDCVYHFSNGKQTPPGFDLARDAILVAKKLGLIQVSGSWLSWNKRRWQGELKGLQWLSQNPEGLRELVQEITATLEAQRKASLSHT